MINMGWFGGFPILSNTHIWSPLTSEYPERKRPAPGPAPCCWGSRRSTRSSPEDTLGHGANHYRASQSPSQHRIWPERIKTKHSGMSKSRWTHTITRSLLQLLWLLLLSLSCPCCSSLLVLLPLLLKRLSLSLITGNACDCPCRLTH